MARRGFKFTVMEIKHLLETIEGVDVEHFCVNVEHFWSGDLAPSPLRPLPPPSLCGSQGRCLPPLLRIPSELDGKPAEGGGGGGGGG
jgi:hypothetical protein